MSIRRMRLTAAVAVVMVAFTSGCAATVEGRAIAGDIQPPTPTTPAPPDPANVPEGFDETPEVELVDGKPGGTLRVADFAPATLLPSDAVSGSDVLVTSNVYTSLTRVTPDLEIEPGAAKSWESDATCRKWTFALHDGGKFHNGEPVTSKSFVTGWKTAAKGTGAGYQLAGIKGYPKVGSGLKAVDDGTLRVELSAPDCEFPLRASHPVFSPLPEAKNPKEQPVGNGPFTVAEKGTPGQPVKLARWDDYAIGDKANLDAVEIISVGSPEAALTGFGTEFDWARATGAVLRNLRDEHAPRGNWIAKKVPGYTGLVPMVKTKPMNSAAARKALSHAIDREKLSEVVFDGSLPPASGVVSSTFEGVYQEDACSACRYDPARAKQLAEQARLGRTTEITLTFPRRPETDRWAETIKAQVENVLDVKVKVRGQDPSEFYERKDGSKARGLYRGAWLPDAPTPDDMLRPLLSTDGIAAGNNIGRYSNKTFDTLLDNAAKTNDKAKRDAYYQQAEKLAIGTDLAIIPLLERKEYRVVNNEKFANLRMDFFENPDLRVATIR